MKQAAVRLRGERVEWNGKRWEVEEGAGPEGLFLMGQLNDDLERRPIGYAPQPVLARLERAKEMFPDLVVLEQIQEDSGEGDPIGTIY